MVQRGDVVSAGYGSTGGTSSSRCRWSWPQWSTTRTALHGARRQPLGPGLRSASCTPCHGARSHLSPPARSLFTMLDEDSDVPELGGGRLVSLTQPRGPQERVLQRTMEPGPGLLVVPATADGGPVGGSGGGYAEYRALSRSSSRALSSSSSTFQFRTVVFLALVFTVFSQDRVLPLLWSRSPTFPVPRSCFWKC